MYWSVYDFLILLSGLIALVIPIAPVAGIPGRTRIAAGAIGGGLVVISIVLGSVPFFRYPWVVFAAPIVSLLSVIAVIGRAVRGPQPRQAGEQEHLMPPTDRPDSAQGSELPGSRSLSAGLTSEELMHLAVQDRSSWIEIARHPAAYEGLLDWLVQHGDDLVRAEVDARRQRLLKSD